MFSWQELLTSVCPVWTGHLSLPERGEYRQNNRRHGQLPGPTSMGWNYSAKVTTAPKYSDCDA